MNRFFRFLSKGTAVLFLLCIGSRSLFAQNSNGLVRGSAQTFYYFGNNKIALAVSSEIIYYRTASAGVVNQVKQKISQSGIVPSAFKSLGDGQHMMIDLRVGGKTGLFNSITDYLKADPNVVLVRPALVSEDGKANLYDELFYLKLKRGISIATMQALVQSKACTVLQQYQYDNRTFIVNATAANGYDALKMANAFYETGLFEFAEPDFTVPDMSMAPPTPATDPNYSLQWALKNTGSAAQFNGVAGCDINIENAWDITKGSATVKVAVIDEGVQSTHPDLAANMLPGFDATTNTVGGTAGNPLATARAHGTNCAGIIAAVSDNGIGIAGIAPLCKIVPVNVASSSGTFTSSANLALAIDWAWQTGGADVLSNSWGGGTASSLVHDAIIRASSLGRGGKGCVVVFSSGNNDAAVASPACFDENIAVGAINMHNQRKSPTSLDGENFWGGNYGRKLDVTAPGVKIASTDIVGSGGYTATDYNDIFNGTSAAAPHVSGIAALIISQFGSLTGRQVKEIIEQSCRKVPGYAYAVEADHANGKWNSETGYGMVNAFNALQLAGTLAYCPKPQIAAAGDLYICSGSSVALSVTNIAGGASYQWKLNDVLAGTGTSINANTTGIYTVVSTTPNCTDTSAGLRITVQASLGTLIASAGNDTATCPDVKILIGGRPSAKAGVPFVKRQRGYGWEFTANSLVRFNPQRADYEYSIVKAGFLNATDNAAGNFTAGGDFTAQGYYAIKRNTNQLVRIDTITGSMDIIGVCNFNSSSNAPTGLAYDSTTGNTYIITSNFSNQNQLWRVNLATAQTTLVGTGALTSPIWLTCDRSGQLYTLNLNDEKVYKLNKTTGATTALPGTVGVDANFAQDADVDPINDTLWMAQYSKASGSGTSAPYTNSWRMLNKTTGTATTISDIGEPLNELDAIAIGGGTYQYQWSPATNLSNDKDANPFFLSSTPGVYAYTLTVTDLCGNTSTDAVNITVHPKPLLPVITYTDTFLNHKRAFSDTFRFARLAGNVYDWMQNGFTTGVTDSFFAVTRPSLQPVPLRVKTTSTLTGCTDTSAGVNVRYGAGILQNDHNELLVCDSNFYDSGGPLVNYAGNFTKVYRPSTAGKKLRLTIYKLNLGANHLLSIYDGAGTVGNAEIGRLNSTSNNEVAKVFTSSAPDGAITVQIAANTSGPGTTGGWLAGFLCVDPLIFRSISNGLYSNKAIWESKPVGAPDNAYTAASAPPGKGDDTVYIRHNVGINTDQFADQLVINNGAILEVQAGGVLYIPKTIPAAEVEVNGTLKVASGRFILGSGAARGVILLKNTLDNAGEISCDSVVTAGSGAVVLKGVAGSRINRLRIDNPTGATVDGQLNIGGSGSGHALILVNGILRTLNAADFVQIQSGAGIQGGSATSYVDGKLRQSINSSNTDVERFYPVGDNNLYKPVEMITNHQDISEDASVNYEVEMVKAAATTRTLPLTLTSVNNSFHHKASIVGSATRFVNARMKIYYGNDGVLNASQLRVAKDDGGTNWVDLGGSGTANGTGSITSDPFTSFSDFVLADAGGALPVTWLYFKGWKSNQQSNLEWATANEFNTKEFIIERSIDGVRFSRMATVTAQGTTAGTHTYNTTDAVPFKGVNYYRLKQLDKDGKFVYSIIVKIDFDQSRGLVINPNPVSDWMMLTLPTGGAAMQSSVYDAEGRLLLTQKLGTATQARINVAMLPTGSYRILLTDGSKNYVSHFIKR
ncbi:MAG: S8 family peptidase [Bacteroidota bacterium]